MFLSTLFFDYVSLHSFLEVALGITKYIPNILQSNNSSFPLQVKYGNFITVEIPISSPFGVICHMYCIYLHSKL